MKTTQPQDTTSVDVTQTIFALRHLESGEFICLRHEGHEFLASFTDGDSAHQFRDELGLLEHCEIASMPLGEAPFDHFWLDGEMVAAKAADRDGAAARN
jgi:hypothetical protein